MTPFHSSQQNCYQRIIVLQSTFKSFAPNYVEYKGLKSCTMEAMQESDLL